MFDREEKAKKAPFPPASAPMPPKKPKPVPTPPPDEDGDTPGEIPAMKKPMGKSPKKGFGDAPIAPGPVSGQPPMTPTKPAKPKPGPMGLPNNIQPGIGKAKKKI